VLEHVQAIRYVTPLREGGSLPGIVEADDDGTYVVKFRGAGQGLKVLVAEVIVGEIGRAIGVRVPDMRALQTVRAICRGEQAPGRPALDRLGQRFGWLAAPRSTVVQPSPVHGGLTGDPAAELQPLLIRLVG
jgi:Protein of unknown function (DUF3037).